jgi:hypothetical protein
MEVVLCVGLMVRTHTNYPNLTAHFTITKPDQGKCENKQQHKKIPPREGSFPYKHPNKPSLSRNISSVRNSNELNIRAN